MATDHRTHRSRRPSAERNSALVGWYRSHARTLPWRGTTDPYRILVSEVMLQQTQVARVIPAYARFLERFPTAETLAAAPLSAVIEAWRGLGYNARAKRLREAAAIVADDGWPTTAAGLRALPGVGPYTAAAVASFAFGERVPAVDTNLRRVISRWAGEPLSGSHLLETAAAEVAEDAATWTQSVMDLAASLCRPRDPRCAECPVARWCTDPTIYQPPPKQAPFAGSDREIRGAVLRSVDASEWSDPATVALDTGHSPARVAAAVASLADDGLLEVGPRGIRLPD